MIATLGMTRLMMIAFWAFAVLGSAQATTNQILFSEAFDYAEGVAIDQAVGTQWQGRYAAPDVSAVAHLGQAQINIWRSLTASTAFLNKRDTYTHIAVDLFGAGGANYQMDVGGAYGLTVSFDGVNRVNVRSSNLGFAPGVNSQGFRVVSASGKIHVDIYLIDQNTKFFITDDQGVQTTPLWHNPEIYGDVKYRLSLGYGGKYDNVLIEYTDALPLDAAPRGPVLVTTSLVEGVIGNHYILPQADWMIPKGIFQLQQIRADGGTPPLSYTITSGTLPPGLTFSTQNTQPTDNISPPQWLAVLDGIPTTAGNYPINIQVKDALGRVDKLSYTLVVNSQTPPKIYFNESFTGTSGAVINDVSGSQWTGRYGATTVSGVYENNRARIKQWMTLAPTTVFRNAVSRYIHAGVQVFQGVGGTIQLNCGGNGFGIVASYDGDHNVTIRSNNLGYAPQTILDTLTVSPSAGGVVNLDIYLKGADTRTYATVGGINQATEIRHNSRLEGVCEKGDYTLTLGYAGLYDEVIVEDVQVLPELYNPVRIVSERVLKGYQQVPYYDILTATSGKPPYTWSASNLPPGLALTQGGILTGTPTVPGNYSVVFTVKDALQQVSVLPYGLTVDADPNGNLLFADSFDQADTLNLVERDSQHWGSLPNTPFALEYGRPLNHPASEGWMVIQPHKQGWLKTTFPNDGITPTVYQWRMTKGRGAVVQVDTCWGMQVEYDGIQHITLRWNDMCWQPYQRQQDFLLENLGDVISVAIEVKGAQFALRIQDSKQTYLRGPYVAPRVQVGQPLSVQFSDNTPYGEGKYTSYQSGPSYIDDLAVRNNVWTVVDGAPLRRKEQLGQVLFFDPILSGDNHRACASCHQAAKGLADGLVKEQGLNGQPLARHTPGLANLALQGAFFWDGREPKLEQVALHPIQSSQEMNQTLPELVGEIAAIPAYQQSFNAIWPDGVTAANIGEALAAYVRTQMELRTAYDANLYRQGTLTADEDAGFILFNGKAGCSQCHRLTPVTAVGSTVYSTPLYKVIGVPGNVAATELDGDIGREAVTGNSLDRAAFRVPNLRNLTRTAPYMHNGVFATLDQVVDFYNAGAGKGMGLPVANQAVELLPLGLSSVEKQQLVAFLKALSPVYPNYSEIPGQVPSGFPSGGSDPILAPANAGLSGKVTTGGADPLVNILVEAYQLGYNNTWTLAGTAKTNATGDYVVKNLTAGVYRIYFLDANGKYVAAYFDNGSDFSSARTVTVADGVTEPNVNMSLFP